MASSILAGIDRIAPDSAGAAGNRAPVEISEDAAREVHRDAVHLKRSEFLQAATISIAAIAASVFIVLVLGGTRRYYGLMMAMAASSLIVRSIVLGLEWRRLLRDTPAGTFERERREDAEVAAHRSRMRQLGPRAWTLQLTFLIL